MKSYIIQRLLLTIPILLGVSFISFLLINLSPSDPAEVALRVNEIIPTPEAIESMRVELGLDKPFFFRYFDWLYHALHFDFGYSYTNTTRTVSDEILRSLPQTLLLSFSALIVTIVICLPLGILTAVYQNSLFDRLVRYLVFLGTAMPSFWLALLLIWLFAMHWDLLPTSGSGTFAHLILPTITLSFVYIAVYIRLLRNSMLSNSREYYVYYAQARGLKSRTIILKHILRNSLHSSITALGMSIPQLIAGTVVIEAIFAWPGIGSLCFSAIRNRDYPVIQAYTLMMAVLFVFCNLMIDIIHQIMDPRLRHREVTQ